MRSPPLRAECCRSSVVERILGKAEVGSSILPGSTSIPVERHLRLEAPIGPAATGGRKLSLSTTLSVDPYFRRHCPQTRHILIRHEDFELEVAVAGQHF